MILVVLLATWKMGAGAALGFQLFEYYEWAYPAFRFYSSQSSFWELKVGYNRFRMSLAGELPGVGGMQADTAYKADLLGEGFFVYLSKGFRFVQPEKRNCLLGVWDILTAPFNMGDEKFKDTSCCLSWARFGPPDVMLGAAFSMVNIRGRLHGEPFNPQWQRAGAVGLGLSFPLAVGKREVGSLYWMGLVGNWNSETGFSLMTPLMFGFDLWLLGGT